jgi:O-antigen biosynthesis protein
VSRRTALLQAVKIGKRSQDAWNRITVRLSRADDTPILYITLNDQRGELLSGNLYLQDPAPRPWQGRTHQLVCFIPQEATEARLFAIGQTNAAGQAKDLILRPLSRTQASAHFLLHARWAKLVGFLRVSSLRPRVLRRQIRYLLRATANEAQIARQDYSNWVTLFDHWSNRDIPSQPARPSISYLVLAREQPTEALTATLHSLEGQQDGSSYTVLSVRSGLVLSQATNELEGEYIGIVQAGEVLPPHATKLAADQIRRLGRPDIAIVDEDRIELDGMRHSPNFKPTPNHAMMLSACLSRGLWLVRRATLLRHAPPAADWAEELRLAVWLARYMTGAQPFSRRIPFVLTHRRPDVETAPPAVLAATVERHLKGGGPSITPVPTWPLTFQLREVRAEERVTMIIPSTLRQPQSLSCIRAVLEGTDYSNFDLHIAVMQPGPLDALQRAGAEVLSRYPNLTVTLLEGECFNFSSANNSIAARTKGDHILLLNDDVWPIRRNWLRWMAAFLRDPQMGIVGARLLYPDGRVQHGGIIMGLAGLCDHAHRYLLDTDPGYMSRAVVAQELSAVTGACLLVRRSLYEQVCGLDESYPSAFNDVDFALRIGETGHSVIYVPQAELYHHELQTYESHYAGKRKLFKAEEVRRMRARWTNVCAADPFHNPNLCLTPNFEWTLAFPPRTGVEY